MYPRLIEVQNAAEASAVKQALAMVRELDSMADGAADGHVIAAVEQAALDRGRRFTRDRIQDVLNRQAEDLEKKGGADGPALVAVPGDIKVGPSGVS